MGRKRAFRQFGNDGSQYSRHRFPPVQEYPPKTSGLGDCQRASERLLCKSLVSLGKVSEGF